MANANANGAALPDIETLLDWYQQMVLIREFEEACYELYQQKRITGVYLHLYSGHEAVGVGALAAIEKSDHAITAYRDHGIALVRGVDPAPLMAEMMGKRTGVSGGKGGSMHLASRDHNFWGGFAIVGGHLPLAAGIALEAQYSGRDEVVLSFVGDGATNNGYFHESLNLSAVWQLPVVWLIENNLYGMGTRIEEASGQPHLHKRAGAYGMLDGGRVDGQDVVAVNEALTAAVAHARSEGPVLVEAITYRYRGHGVSDRQYNERLKEELDEWKRERDPITLLGARLEQAQADSQPIMRALEQAARDQVAAAVQFAEDSPLPDAADLVRNVYVE